MLQYICKVYLKFFEQSGSEDKYCQREYPEIKCQYRVVPDCHFVYQGVTIPLDNIKPRIQFEYFLKDPAKPEIIEVPHDRSHPDTYLQGNVDDLA